MKKYYYDLHVHSCLSPCGNDDNTPANIAGIASLSELDIVALTDHNTCKNCPAFFKAAEKYGARVAEVGKAFLAYAATGDKDALYDPDRSHPSALGSAIAAKVIWEQVRA